MTIRHKFDIVEISEFPYWYKYNSLYGYLVVTNDNRVLFFNSGDEYTFGYHDLTDVFEVTE